MPEKAGMLIGIGGLVVVSVLWVMAPFAVAQSTVPLEPLRVEELQPLPAPAPEPEPIPVFEYGPKGLVAVPKARMSLKEQGLDPLSEATVIVRLQHLSLRHFGKGQFGFHKKRLDILLLFTFFLFTFFLAVFLLAIFVLSTFNPAFTRFAVVQMIKQTQCRRRVSQRAGNIDQVPRSRAAAQ